jgi:hypothetical protein
VGNFLAVAQAMRSLLFLICSILSLTGATTNQIVKDGITFQFDSNVEFGQYVNGDYWVVGPVNITNMLPEWNGTYHGWEIDPKFSDTQGFADHSAAFGYDAAKRPALPLSLSTNCTLIKTIGTGRSSQNDTAIYAAVPLTIETSTPPANAFRPPYIRTNGVWRFTTADFRTNLLPSKSSSLITNRITLSATEAAFNVFDMDHHSDSARQMRPELWGVSDGYQPERAKKINDGILALFLDDTQASKALAAYRVGQWALDRAFIIECGYRNPQTGHNPVHRVPAAFGAVMFGLTNILATCAAATTFHEDARVVWGTNANRALWGLVSSTLSNYKAYWTNDSGDRSHRDPWTWVDGGAQDMVIGTNILTRAGYLEIVQQGYKGMTLIASLMTNIQTAFESNRWFMVRSFSERLVTNGFWYANDPLAPYDGIPGNDGVTWGGTVSSPVTNGVGRFTSAHGTSQDGGQYTSQFVREIWLAHFTAESSGGGGSSGRAFSAQIGGRGVTFGGKGVQIR